MINPLIKTCLGGVFWVFHGIFLALFDIFSREPYFGAENQIFKNFSKSLQTCLVGVFWEFRGIFSIGIGCALGIARRGETTHSGIDVNNTHPSMINPLIKTCLGGVFWVFHGIFLALFDIFSREPYFGAENQIFKNFSKSLQTCLVGVFCEFRGIFSIMRHLSREPDFSAKTRILKKFFKSLKTCSVGVFWVFQGILA